MHRRHLLALAVTAAAAPALAPSGAEAATCFKYLDGPTAEDKWGINKDGAEEGAYYLNGGSNFADGNGRLTVNGTPYPEIPHEDDACTQTTSSITFPAKQIGGFTVRRTVAGVQGRVRRIDSLTNTGDVQKLATVDFDLRVLGSQVVTETESGDGAVTEDDHWSLHDNDNGSHPFAQWGVGPNSHDPDVIPSTWKHEFGVMPGEATLRYKSIPVGPGETIRLLHVNGTSGSAADSKAAATDRLTPFLGLSKTTAASIVNWGQDADGDGVPKSDDNCPAVKGTTGTGCLGLNGVPVDPEQPGDPQPPADPGTPANPVDPGQPGQSGTSFADTIAPKLTIKGIGRKAKRARLSRRGLAARLSCNEACTVRVTVLGRKRTVTIAAGATRTLKLTFAKKQLKRRQLKLAITATDVAGNRTAKTRTVRVAR